MAEKPKGLYVPVDVNITDDEDLAAVGTFGLGVYVAGLAYCKRRRTDGYIPHIMVRSLLLNPSPEEIAELDKVVDAFLASGLWISEPCGEADGYRIRNWDLWNPTESDRERWLARKNKQRHGHVTEKSRGSHGEVTGKSRSEVEVEVEVEENPLFDEFWNIYPRKAGKGGARKAFTKALAKASLSDILSGARTYASIREGKDPNYTKHPSTWLNQECWTDEAPSAEDNDMRPFDPASVGL